MQIFQQDFNEITIHVSDGWNQMTHHSPNASCGPFY